MFLLFITVSSILQAGTWEKIDTFDAPTLSGHTCVYDSSAGNIYVMGDANLIDGNIYRLDINANDKSWVVSASSDTVKRTGHSAVFDSVKNRMIVFGGNNSTYHNIGATNTTYVFDSLNRDNPWAVLNTTGTDIPSARSAHCAVFDPKFNRMIIFGGRDKDEEVLNSTYALDLSVTPSVWTKISLAYEPYPRRQSSAIYDTVRQRMVIYGGLMGQDQPTDEIYALDLSNANLTGLRWERISPASKAPADLARTGHVSVYNSAGDTMQVFGGWAPMSLTEAYYNTTYTFNFNNNTWTQVQPGPDIPAARRSFSGVYDAEGNRMIIFGGASGSGAYTVYYNDLYALAQETKWSPYSGKDDIYNYPNPFNPNNQVTTIKFYCNDSQEVKISLYSLIGEPVKDWTVKADKGINSVNWDGLNGEGKKVESGGYICVIERDGQKNKFKIAVVK